MSGTRELVFQLCLHMPAGEWSGVQGSSLHSDRGVSGHHCATGGIRDEGFLRKAMPHCLTEDPGPLRCLEQTSQEAAAIPLTYALQTSLKESQKRIPA